MSCEPREGDVHHITAAVLIKCSRVQRSSFFDLRLRLNHVQQQHPSCATSLLQHVAQNPPRKEGEPFRLFQYTNVYTHQVEYEWELGPETLEAQARRVKEECAPRFCPGNRECELVKDDDGEEACCRCGVRNPWQKRTAVGDGPEEARSTDPNSYIELHPVSNWKWGRYPGAMLQRLVESGVPKEVRKFCKKAFKNPADFQKDWTQHTKREFFRKHGDQLPSSVASFFKDFRCAPSEWRMYRIDDEWERASKAEHRRVRSRYF